MGGVLSVIHHLKTNPTARFKPNIKYQSAWQTSQITNLGFTPEVVHKYTSSTLPQPQEKKKLQPQRHQVKWFANEFQTWPLCTADRRGHFLVLDLHLVQTPSPFIPLLLSIYWIRKPYSRKRTFHRTQHQHFQYSDIWLCRPPYSIPCKYLRTLWGTTQTPSLTALSMESEVGFWKHILCFHLDVKTEPKICKSVFETGEWSQDGVF